MLIRRAAILLVVGLISACSSTKKPDLVESSRPTSPIAAAISGRVVDACASNRSKCKFEGSYEAGERDYAEQEAKRLNTAELERLRRAFGN